MKRPVFTAAQVAMAVVLLLATVGCTRNDDARLAALEKRVATLEAKDWVAAGTAPSDRIVQPTPGASAAAFPAAGSEARPTEALPISTSTPTKLVPVTFSGIGLQASAPQLFEKALYVFTMRHSGDRNFIAHLMNTDGKKIALLAAVNGPFTGSKAFAIPAKAPYLVDVDADGSWAIVATAPGY